MKFMKAMALLFILSLISFYNSSSSVSAKEPIGGIERDYYFRVELSQWSITVYDMNQIEDFMLQGKNLEYAMDHSRFKYRIGPLEKASHVYLEIYSMDVQHGFSAKKLDLTIVATKPKNEYNKPILVDFILPDDDVSISATCHVYCGLGHSDMKLKFVVGKGDPDIGNAIFMGFIALNIIIFTYTLRLMLIKLSKSE